MRTEEIIIRLFCMVDDRLALSSGIRRPNSIPAKS
jgi:hypothetical protein